MENSLIKLISASAGSGKTYRLTEELSAALDRGIRPEAVFATTFTNRAAAELTERVRLKLLEKGKWDAAQQILDGYIGTVNAVCGRLLKLFAFEAGLSPDLDVLPEEEAQAIYNRSIASVIETYASDIDPIAQKFELDDWQDVVKKITDAARSNNIFPKNLHKCAERSWKGFKKLLPEAAPQEMGKVLDKKIFDSIKKAAGRLNRSGDLIKKSQKVLNDLNILLRTINTGEALTWRDWVKLTKLDPGAANKADVEDVIDAARAHPIHPRFQRDAKKLIENIFACAVEAMEAFAGFKKVHGLIDFIDQENLCLEILQRDDVREMLRERLDIVLVDEFQDTSPIQLAVFLTLTEIVSQSAFVGDQKQAIFGFRGTDPSLMDAVIDTVIGPENIDILKYSYRSRPGLVKFTSSLFSRAFETVGIPPDRVNLSAIRKDGKGQATPLNVWWLGASNIDKETNALAVGVGEMLSAPEKYLVEDKITGKLRPLKPADIAILCRLNIRCALVAECLESYGIRAGVARQGLLSQPESVLALAGLRYLADPYDSVAAAEIMHFTENKNASRAWFAEWQKQGKANKPWLKHPLVAELDSVRENLIHLTPAEALDLAIEKTQVNGKTLQWGNPAHRLANVEALRGLAKTYEEYCLVQRKAATPAGLVTYLIEEVKGGELDDQAEGRDENAVQVLTYHSAKGLEWPVVILFDLQTKEKVNPFGVHVIPSKKGFDAHRPLAGRWIRFWPWPYGSQQKNVGLDDAVSESPERNALVPQHRKEMIRLLYVGMTRARDYLMLSVRNSTKTDWLDFLTDASGNPLLRLPQDTGSKLISVSDKSFDIRVNYFFPNNITIDKGREAAYVTAAEKKQIDFLPARIVPSSAASFSDVNFKIKDVIKLGEPLPLAGRPDMNSLGKALHAFLAVDDPLMQHKFRLETAERILKNWQIASFDAETLLVAADRLSEFVKQEFGENIVRYREWPVHLKIGEQKASGWIDLLLETPKGYVIIDHKIFHENLDKLKQKVEEFSPQLLLYKKAIETAKKQKVISTFLHLPVHGVVVRLVC